MSLLQTLGTTSMVVGIAGIIIGTMQVYSAEHASQKAMAQTAPQVSVVEHDYLTKIRDEEGFLEGRLAELGRYERGEMTDNRRYRKKKG